MDDIEDCSLLSNNDNNNRMYKNSNLSSNSENSFNNDKSTRNRVQDWNNTQPGPKAIRQRSSEPQQLALNINNNNNHNIHHRNSNLNSSFDEDSDLTFGVVPTTSHHHRREDYIPVERLKTVLFALYTLFGTFIATLTMQVTNERVEHNQTVQAPLRDVVWDLQKSYAKEDSLPELFRLTEIWGIIQMATFFGLLIFHKHRLVILRRFFFVVGTLYIYRSFTTVVTSLPVPGLHVVCQPYYGENYNFVYVMKQTFKTLSGFGMQMTNDPKLACGGYLFSGHTVVILSSLLYNFRYIPQHIFLHNIIYKIWRYISITMSSIGILCVILAHEHYTVDVVVAYYFITRLFWGTHSIWDSKTTKNDMKKAYISVAEVEYFEKFSNSSCQIFNHSSGNTGPASGSTSNILTRSLGLSNAINYNKDDYTHNPMRKMWYVRVIMWSEYNIILKNSVLPFEYESPFKALVVMVKDIKNAFMRLMNSSHRNARKGYDMVRERTEIV